jgi:Glyoxalase-like domain
MQVFIDLPGDLLEPAGRFWSAVTGAEIGAPWPDHEQFRSLEPATASRYVHLQRRGGPPRLHPDLSTPDVDAETARMVGLGATAQTRQRWWQVLTSPGGQEFCLVEATPERSRPGPASWPTGHRSRLSQLTLDVPAPRYEAEWEFWLAATGWRERRGRRREFRWLLPPDSSPLRLLMHRLGDDDTAPAVRGHLDVGSDDVEAEVRRVVELGARVSADRRRDGGSWVVLLDPVGLPFCVTEQPPD